MAGAPFVTPQNERSFSAMVDKIVLETGRQQALLSIIGYTNLTIRECHSLGLFARDLIEDEVVGTADPHIYTRPRNWRSLRAVKYDRASYYPKMRRPGRAVQEETYFFYAADDYYAFHGVQVGESIFTAAYYWSKPLRYFGRLGTVTTGYIGGPYTNRPAYFDIDTSEWMYLNAAETAYTTAISPADEDEEALRRGNAMTWILDDWWDVIAEGVKAKLFKAFKDERAGAAYASYSQGQEILRNTVGAEAEVTSIIGETA